MKIYTIFAKQYFHWKIVCIEISYKLDYKYNRK